MKKSRLPKKSLTDKEAREKKELCIADIQNLQEEILYWRVRLNKPLAKIDQFILMADTTVNTPEEIINRNIRLINQKTFLIQNYYNTFIESRK